MEGTSKKKKKNMSKQVVKKKFPGVDELKIYDHLLFVDLNQFRSFFKLLTRPFPVSSFIFLFCGDRNYRFLPPTNKIWKKLLEEERIFYHPKFGTTSGDANIAIKPVVENLDSQLPQTIPFTILTSVPSLKELPSVAVDSGTNRKITVISQHQDVHTKVNMVMLGEEI
ncbi:E3 SUMO-protein ligase ZNF451-like [Limulus polyphemus]|uniref:E3 SUMO-protein ligase ZNF451-like n=1 Tax=Limulus polyphemus TaxID=6850 RepID=A0ABM1RV31_LIMPO|nr:E3 SUMO-protein ligase ZNF451-like [Limulus polyphemus]XP_022235227.1 E3 SUMO-protein ligase ZNF451-like [Limulus polyphemus]XP_022235234.1 E3 SUMO-protein ligase ZNF451-like [Limulus polyphemus]XP_022235236.1 E3 SUMO-protein ligase ZNF451-like [Limulus polyphemus]XP_022235242.1 E3 SUMO-protein ligase ZNF451-like [Limulus polyphemus]XP_022235245.1 E3 SUMO-protein ligase ZNF451-like [Limulus polyphemus]